MIPIIYKPDETNFSHNGIGLLKDATKCTVTEERNGMYELELQYPVDGHIYQYINDDCIIKAKPNDTAEPQLFKIYKQTKPINGVVTYNAQHISYELTHNLIERVSVTDKNAQQAITAILDAAIITHRYTAQSDITTLNSIDLTLISPRAALGGTEGSVLDVYGGEYEFDNFVVKLHKARGKKSGVKLAYGKNITDFTKEKNIADVYTAVYPYAKYTPEATDSQEAQEIVVTLPEKLIYSDKASNYATTRVCALDFTETFAEGEQITVAGLRAKAQNWVKTSGFDTPSINITVSFVSLWQSPEYEQYADLERVSLCDTVDIYFDKYNISATAKVIKTVYDCLLERYESIELGDAKSNFADTINQTVKGIDSLHQEIQTQTAKITQDFKAADGQLLSKIQAEYPNKETVQSEIAQSANNIMLSVSQGYATKASLELKVGKDDNNQIVSMLNAAADLINIESNRIAISSTYFTLTNDGALTCTSANLTGTMTAGNNTHSAKLDGGSLKFINDSKHISSFGTTTWAGTSTLGTAVHSEAAAKFVSFGNKSSVGDTQYTTQFALNYGLNPGGIKQDVIVYGSSYFGDAMTVKEANIIFAGYDYSSYLQPATFNGNPAIHASNAFYADGEIYAMGNLGCKGTKNRIVDTDHYGDRKLYAYEMTAPMFGDYGSAQTDDTGTIKIYFDSVFLETVESGLEYFVFIQKQCPGDMYVSKKEPDGFTVTGSPNGAFDWEVKFRQKGCRTERLEVFNPPAVNDGRQLKSKAAPHTKPFKKAKLRRQGNDNNR